MPARLSKVYACAFTDGFTASPCPSLPGVPSAPAGPVMPSRVITRHGAPSPPSAASSRAPYCVVRRRPVSSVMYAAGLSLVPSATVQM